MVTNSRFMELVRNYYGMRIGLPTPSWVLKIGAYIIGTETELILKSRWVYPKNLLEKAFKFRFPSAAAAIQDVLSAG